MKYTQTELDKAEKKVQIAIDKMIDLQDMGFGNSKIETILQMLNSLETEINLKRNQHTIQGEVNIMKNNDKQEKIPVFREWNWDQDKGTPYFDPRVEWVEKDKDGQGQNNTQGKKD